MAGADTLLWTFGAITFAGVFLGFFLRVPALIAASAILAALGCGTSMVLALTVASAASLMLCALLTLQVSYLAGGAASVSLRHLQRRSRRCDPPGYIAGRFMTKSKDHHIVASDARQ